MMGMCGIAKPFVLTVLTSKWADCIIVIQILCFAYMLSCVSDINLNILYAKGRSDLVLRLEIAKKTIAIVLLLLVLQYGIVAICLSRLLYSIIALYLNSFYTKRILNYEDKKNSSSFRCGGYAWKCAGRMRAVRTG